MQIIVANHIKNTIPQKESSKEYLKFVEEHFRSADKSLAGSLMAEPMTMKFDGPRNMKNYITEMTNIASRFWTLGMKVDDTFLVQFILNSLLLEYGPFQINYNTIKDKWHVSKLSNMLTQDESKLKKQVSHSIKLMGQGAGKGLIVKVNKIKKKKPPAKVLHDAYKALKVDGCCLCKSKRTTLSERLPKM
ncbi:hypothetical protein EJD97_014220 [Solanum chilense]|uniref:UBN2_2 domain-containing protein n=1 Tax=Solanum chilense TaxID=4083 RepID=A0A6N2BC16_SOLCI|nr:hypothetical protein EJD97_014220 [Solanum chilense]